jgi:hypothetical protein
LLYAVFVVYWRVSRRGYWLLIVSAAIWLGTMVAMKLLLPLDYVPARWSIPHWCSLSLVSRHASCLSGFPHHLLTLRQSVSRAMHRTVCVNHALLPEPAPLGPGQSTCLACSHTSHENMCSHRALPWLPCTSIFFNVFLMGNLPYKSFIRFGVLIGTGLIIYFLYGLHGSYDRFLCAPLLFLLLVFLAPAHGQL